MAQEIISNNKSVHSVSYRLPNKHYIPVSLAHVGLENLKP
jgi:urate oxidase